MAEAGSVSASVQGHPEHAVRRNRAGDDAVGTHAFKTHVGGLARRVGIQIGECPIVIAGVKPHDGLELDVAADLVCVAAGPEQRGVMAAVMRGTCAIGPIGCVGGPDDELATVGALILPFAKNPFAHGLAVIGGAGKHLTQRGILQQRDGVAVAGGQIAADHKRATPHAP